MNTSWTMLIFSNLQYFFLTDVTQNEPKVKRTRDPGAVYRAQKSMCRHIYDWNIVNCDVKQPIQQQQQLVLDFYMLTMKFWDIYM